MSVTQEANIPRLLALCKEYTKTVNRTHAEAESLVRQWNEAETPGTSDKLRELLKMRCRALYFGYSTLQSGIEELLRAVSQQIEHSDIEFEDRLELKVRLAELRGKLNETQTFLSALLTLVT